MASKSEDKSRKQLEALKSRIDKQKIGEVLDEIFHEYYVPNRPEKQEEPKAKQAVIGAKQTEKKGFKHKRKTHGVGELSSSTFSQKVGVLSSRVGELSSSKSIDVEVGELSSPSEVNSPTIESLPELLSAKVPATSYWFRYTVVNHWIYDHLPNVFPAAKFMVYQRLFRLAYGFRENNGTCETGLESLAKSCNLSKKWVIKIVSDLEREGYIKRLALKKTGPNKQRGTVYQVFISNEAVKKLEELSGQKSHVGELTSPAGDNIQVGELTSPTDVGEVSSPNILKDSYISSHHHQSKEQDGDESSTLSLPMDSYFQEVWLKNYLSSFPKEEQSRIKKLAERFDHFMLTAGKNKEWVKNPTGTFVGLVRGEVNVPLPQYAPSFEARVEEEKRIEVERSEQEEEKRRKNEIEKEIREAISLLEGEEREKFIKKARKKYDFRRLVSDESVLESVVFHILYELEESEVKHWREIWDNIHKDD